MIHDERGSTYLETLIAVPILFIGFVTLFMFARLGVAHLIVQRAAAAAVRAAVVMLPDDPDYYEANGGAPKEACVKEAVRRVLMASPHFKTDAASITVNITGARSNFNPLTVEVLAQYDCNAFIGSASFFGVMLCGRDRVATISSTSTLAYQMGPLEQ